MSDAVIFSGDLAPYSSQGVGVVLFGNFAACSMAAIMGGCRTRESWNRQAPRGR